jgi:hypothetical protein
MPRPDIPGAPVKDYEEVWRKLSYRDGVKGLPSPVSFVLERGTEGLQIAEGEEKRVTRTFIGVIWGTYIVLRQRQVLVRSARQTKVAIKRGGVVSARREDFDETRGFQVKYALGPEAEVLPTQSEIETALSDKYPSRGERLVVRGEEYVVRSFEVAWTRCSACTL